MYEFYHIKILFSEKNTRFSLFFVGDAIGMLIYQYIHLTKTFRQRSLVLQCYPPRLRNQILNDIKKN